MTDPDRLTTPERRPEDLDVLTNVADNIQGRTICALGDAAALPVKSFIKHFRDEFVHHIQHKRCLVQGEIEPRWGRPAVHAHGSMAEAA